MINKARILIVEDEKILRVSLVDELEDAGYEVFSAPNPLNVLEMIKKDKIDIVLSDIRMPHFNGIELLNKIKMLDDSIYVILMTAYGSIGSAVDAMKKGAYDFITKPFKIDELLIIIDRINELRKLKIENSILKTKLKTNLNFESYIASNEGGLKLLELARTIAKEPTTVLISGETGTGKDLLASIIHSNSVRNERQLIKVSCAVFSRDIFESELFGHEKGAFTGADNARVGRFELADNSTIYLDDIDDIPYELQVKLLRVIEDQEFERVGSNVPIKVNIRFIASTKVDLKELVKEGKFRQDLYYRLNIFPINTLPLRDRKVDLPQLINHFVSTLSNGKDISISQDAIERLQKYNWPGNVRELRNIIERMILICANQHIETKDIPIEIANIAETVDNIVLGKKSLDTIVADFEKNMIIKALQKTHGHKNNAADVLGLPHSTLRTKIKKYEIIFEEN